jgi:hypothetical protein
MFNPGLLDAEIHEAIVNHGVDPDSINTWVTKAITDAVDYKHDRAAAHLADEELYKSLTPTGRIV